MQKLGRPSDELIERLAHEEGVNAWEVKLFLGSVEGLTLDEAIATADLLHDRGRWSFDTYMACMEGLDGARPREEWQA